MAKKTSGELLQQLQDLLNEIAVTPKDQLERFLYLKKRSTRVLNRLKREYPDLKSFPMQGPAFSSLRREGQDPAQGVMGTPDK